MSKIRVLSDHLANQIAAGEVVERPASVAKELVENSIDAGARRLQIDTEAGGRRLLRVTDDGEGMTRDDAVLAFERHATSKISTADDLAAISTLGFRGEALASIASVARVELVTKTASESAATRVIVEGGRMRDVKDAAHPQGTTITVRELFFNVPARRKFLRSEATETFHLTNLVTHYALANPSIAFTMTSNGRETLRVAPAADLRERAYQIFGAEFIENLLEVGGGHELIATVSGFVSAPRERRTSRDAQYLFINGRFVRDRLLGRALTEGYRSVLPHGVYPAALLFLKVPLEEVDVNVHPAKTEVRFRRAAAVADSVREAVRSTLASAGYVRPTEPVEANRWRSDNTALVEPSSDERDRVNAIDASTGAIPPAPIESPNVPFSTGMAAAPATAIDAGEPATLRQDRIAFGFDVASGDVSDQRLSPTAVQTKTPPVPSIESESRELQSSQAAPFDRPKPQSDLPPLPPLVSAANLVREVSPESVSTNIRPIGQLEESFIIATDDEGLLLIDQHVAHERVLYDKYHYLEGQRRPESQNLLIPETFDLTPAQVAAFDLASEELEAFGFSLMRLSGRTVAIKAVPADLPIGEARNMLAEILDTVDPENRGAARETLREDIAASLACHAAIKINTPLAPEKMRWLIDRLLRTSSPTTCPHGRPVILRITMRDIEKGFHRT